MPKNYYKTPICNYNPAKNIYNLPNYNYNSANYYNNLPNYIKQMAFYKQYSAFYCPNTSAAL